MSQNIKIEPISSPKEATQQANISTLAEKYDEICSLFNRIEQLSTDSNNNNSETAVSISQTLKMVLMNLDMKNKFHQTLNDVDYLKKKLTELKNEKEADKNKFITKIEEQIVAKNAYIDFLFKKLVTDNLDKKMKTVRHIYNDLAKSDSKIVIYLQKFIKITSKFNNQFDEFMKTKISELEPKVQETKVKRKSQNRNRNNEILPDGMVIYPKLFSDLGKKCRIVSTFFLLKEEFFFIIFEKYFQSR